MFIIKKGSGFTKIYNFFVNPIIIIILSNRSENGLDGFKTLSYGNAYLL